MPSGYLQYERKVYKKLSNAKKPLKKYGIALYPLLNFVWLLHFSIKQYFAFENFVLRLRLQNKQLNTV